MTTGNRKLASADVGVIAMHIQHAHLGKRGVLDELYCNGRAMSSPELRFALTVFSLSSALVVLIGATRFLTGCPSHSLPTFSVVSTCGWACQRRVCLFKRRSQQKRNEKRLLAFPEDVRGERSHYLASSHRCGLREACLVWRIFRGLSNCGISTTDFGKVFQA